MPLAVLLLVATLCGSLGAQPAVPSAPGRHRIEVRSSFDGSLQPSYLYLPGKPAVPAPLAVILHTWSFDLEQRDSIVENEARTRGWMLLAPNFRGRNAHPEACGSRAAQQDILDAVAWVRANYRVDERQIYLLGLSGGGYMTMLIAARQPGEWAAASAWVGISRRIFLRRNAEPHRVTIFEGGHEWLPRAAIAWLAQQRKPTRDAPADTGQSAERAVRAVAAAIIAADNARNLDSVLALYAPDAVLMPPGEAPVRGRDAIRPRYEALFRTFNPAIHSELDDVRIAGNLAFVSGRNTGELKPRDSGSTPRRLNDLFLMVLSRDLAGRWRIARLMWHAGPTTPAG